MHKGVVALIAALLVAGALWWALAGGGGPSAGDAAFGTGADSAEPGAALQGREPGAADTTSDERGTPSTNPTDPQVTGGVTLSGRVVDLRRRPVAGARVIARFPDRSPVETVSDDGGRYELAIGERPARWVVGTVRATTDGPRVGASPLMLSPSTQQRTAVAAIVIREAHDLDVRVQYAGAPVADAQVVVAYEVWSRMTPLAEGRTDARGMLRVPAVPRGSLRVFAAQEGYGRASMGVRVPRTAEGPVVLELTEEREVTVRVVDAATKRPVAGALIAVGDRHTAMGSDVLSLMPTYVPLPTDERGQTRLRTLGAEDEYHVSATKDGYAPPNPMLGSSAATIAPDEREVTVQLHSFRSIALPIRVGDVAPPGVGDVLRLEVQDWTRSIMASDAGARVEGGQVVVHGLPASWSNGRVVAEDGSFATFTAPMGSATGPPITFREALTARVRVVERGTGPMQGARLNWQGGFAFGNQKPVVTDARGEAVLTGMSSGRISVLLLTDGEAWNGEVVGSIEITPANAADVHVLEVEPPAQITLNVSLDGEPGLPPAYTVQVGKRGLTTSEIEEDAERGTLRFAARLADDAQRTELHVRARGFLSEPLELVGGGDQELDVPLKGAARLVVDVTPPDDGDLLLAVERYADETETWVPARATTPDGGMATSRGKRERFEQVFLVNLSGLVRVRETHSDTYSEPVNVRLAEESRVALDLGNLVWISVTVEAPKGVAVGRARVYRTDVPAAHRLSKMRGNPVDQRGRSRVRARRGERIPLSVVHPICAAAAEGGRVTASATKGAAVTLRLEVANVLTFRLPEPKGGSSQRAARVLLFTGAQDAEPAHAGVTVVKDGVQQLGGFAAGTYTIWIDAFRGAPILLKARALAGGVNDLGLQVPPTGSTVRVTVLHDAPKDPPLIWAIARRVGAPAFSRFATRPQGTDGDLRVTGLVAGSYEVELRVSGSLNRPVEKRTVEVGDTGEVAVTLDLRGG